MRLRRRAVVMLGGIGPAAAPAVPVILARVDSPQQSDAGWFGFYTAERSAAYSMAAIEALGRIGDDSDEVVLALLDAADAGDAQVRACAVEALVRLAVSSSRADSEH